MIDYQWLSYNYNNSEAQKEQVGRRNKGAIISFRLPYNFLRQRLTSKWPFRRRSRRRTKRFTIQMQMSTFDFCATNKARGQARRLTPPIVVHLHFQNTMIVKEFLLYGQIEDLWLGRNEKLYLFGALCSSIVTTYDKTLYSVTIYEL